MKTKKYLLNVIVIFILTSFLHGCNTNDLENLQNVNQHDFFTDIYKDSVFLEIKGDLLEPQVIWGNVQTYLLAYQRMKNHLTFEEKQLKWAFKSATDLNVSDNIYNYVIDAWNEQNKMLATGDYKLTFIENDYRLEQINEQVSTKNASKIVLGNNDRANFDGLKKLIDRGVTGNLYKYVDLKNSKLIGNGVGDVSISGAVMGAYDWNRYYCCNGCYWNNDPVSEARYGCYDNEICMYNSSVTTKLYTQWARNPRQLPLITIQIARKKL